ncbi:hypothetical protein GALL_545850 [mine drainage metagenome]|uniref:Uncharacterized protein n=1 Tax=mine drainage metagenome TaxID=410659 RepID=A0A1J5P012_9ZZZZ
MHDLQRIRAVQFLDTFHRFRLGPQRADLKPQRLDHPLQPMRAQHRQQLFQGRLKRRLPHAILATNPIIARDQRDPLCPNRRRDLHQRLALGAFCLGPVIEHRQLREAQNPQAALCRSRLHHRRRIATKQRATQIVAQLDPDAAQPLRQIKKSVIAQSGGRHMVQRKGQHRGIFSRRTHRSPGRSSPAGYGIDIPFYSPFN